MNAFVMGGATSPFSRQHAGDFDDLTAATAWEALRDADLDPASIDLIVAGSVHGGEGFGQRIAARLGIGGRPVLNLENACATSAVAAHEATLWIRAGEARTALVVGGEVLSARGDKPVATSHSAYDYEAHGVSWPVKYALHAQEDLRVGRYARADLARVAVKNRTFAAGNPHAQFRTPLTEQEVLDARLIADPLTLLMCSAKSDGASALVLADTQRSARSGRPRVRVRASLMRSGQLLDGTSRPRIPITAEVARAVYEKAGIGPDDLDVIELHDAFASAELEHYVSLGLAAEGDAGKLLKSMMASPNTGPIANPGGGLLSRGHPIGATGGAQLVEVYRQLTGEAGSRQVLGARIGLTHTMGGTEFELESNICMVHLLERLDA